MASLLEMYGKFGLANWICLAKCENWSENGQWPTAISSSAMSVFPPIECCHFHSLSYNKMAFFRMKHETKLKRT